MITAKIPEVVSEVNTAPIESNSNYVNYFLLQTNHIHNQGISVAYRTLDGTAKAGKDYIATTGRVTIKAGELQSVIPVTIIGDYIPEDEEYYYLQISDPQGVNFPDGIVNITSKRTIKDDD